MISNLSHSQVLNKSPSQYHWKCRKKYGEYVYWSGLQGECFLQKECILWLRVVWRARVFMRALELQRFLKNLPFIFNAPTWLGRPRFTGGLVKSARPLADSVAQGLVLFRGRRNTRAEMLLITKANSPATEHQGILIGTQFKPTLSRNQRNPDTPTKDETLTWVITGNILFHNSKI